MKNIFKYYIAPGVTLMVLLGVSSCTKLDTKIKDPNSIAPTTAGGAPAPSSLSNVYEQLNQLLVQGNS